MDGPIRILIYVTPDRIKRLGPAVLRALGEKQARLERERAEEGERQQRILAQALSQRLLEAQERERIHIAHELHDEIGQVLTSVKINLQAMQSSAEPANYALRLEDSIAIVSQAIQQVRDLGFYLHPSMLDDLGLIAALRAYLDRAARRAGFIAEFVADSLDTRLPPQLELTLYRVAQEALTNVARHSQARHVRVELRRLPEAIQLDICDDGIGFNVHSLHERAAHGISLGVLGMQERVCGSGGQIKIRSEPGKGTNIHAQIPWPANSDSAS